MEEEACGILEDTAGGHSKLEEGDAGRLEGNNRWAGENGETEGLAGDVALNGCEIAWSTRRRSRIRNLRQMICAWFWGWILPCQRDYGGVTALKPKEVDTTDVERRFGSGIEKAGAGAGWEKGGEDEEGEGKTHSADPS